MDYSRSYSPVPPPCPSPQLKPQPLPTPPAYSRSRRPSLTPSSSSREQVPPKLRMKPSAAASSDSLVFSLKDAIVAGSPSRRRFSEQASFRDPSSSQDTLDRRPRTTEVYRPVVHVPSPSSSSFKRKHRQSDSNSHASDTSFPPSSPPPSRSLARKRTRSPSGAPLSPRSDTPPPVPPLPPLPPTRRQGRSASLFSKKMPPIRIPELGLGLDEKLRTPLSPLISGAPFRKREGRSKHSEPEPASFLQMSPKKLSKRNPCSGRSSLGEREPLSPSCMVRPAHSMPDMKTAKRRSSPSFTSRLFRLGTQQLVH